MQAIANAQKLSFSDDGDAGDLGFRNDGENDGTREGPVQNKWFIKGVFQFVPPDFKFPSCKLEQGLVHWFKGMRLNKGVVWPFWDFVENKEAPPVGHIWGNISTHWKFLFSDILEDGLKAQGMEIKLPPTATPEQLKDWCEKCKIVLKDRVSLSIDDETIAEGKVTT